MCDSETTSGDIQAKSVQDRSHRTLTERITRTKKPGSVTPLGTALAFLVSAVLSLTLAVACLVPLHVSHTRAVPLPPLIDARKWRRIYRTMLTR